MGCGDQIKGIIPAAVLLLAAGPSAATIIDQGSVTVTGGLQDVFVITNDVPFHYGHGQVFLTVDGGKVTDAQWSARHWLQDLWWDFEPGYDSLGNPAWIPVYLDGDETYADFYLGAQQTIVRNEGPRFYSNLKHNVATFSAVDDTPSFNVCAEQDHPYPITVSPPNLCASGTLPGSNFALLNAFNVTASHDFSWTLSDVRPVPEPATWTMLIVGLGLLGEAARQRRRRLPGRPIPSS
jgi:hypothetical protein